jgi:HEAT repeat protein
MEKFMTITSENHAIEILDSTNLNSLDREDAVRYLAYQPSELAIKRLVKALQEDDFGVRWEAAASLAKLGDRGLHEMLKALVDPDRVGDPRLREGAYHMLHYNRSEKLPVPTKKLMLALKGPAPDISTMEEAGKLLQLIEKRNVV